MEFKGRPQELRREIRTVWPRNGVYVGVNADLTE